MTNTKSNRWLGVSAWLVFSACVLVVLSFATAVFASPTGSIVGTVKDPSGASISGAELTLTNLATNDKTEAVSDINGNFQFLQLAPAEYSLVVQSTGFKKLTEHHILVQVDQITHLDVALEVGSVLEVVEVASAVPLLESDRSTLSNVVTKSGTNQFHGSVFEYLRNDVLDAADFFTNKQRGKKNPLHRNQYGATLGGPILKDRMFFFLSYEGFRQVAPTVSSTRVPSDAERASVTDPISKSLLQFWPTANTTPAAGSVINYTANVGATTFDETGLAKVDYKLSEKDHLTARWAQYGGSTFTPGALPLLGGNANAPVSDSGVIDYTHTFSPRLLNELRLGFSRNKTFITVQDSGFDASKIFVDAGGNALPGIVVASKNELDSGLPTINVSGGFARLGSTSNLPQGRITNTYEIYDNMSLVAPFGASKHSWRWGAHVRREDARRFLDGSARGQFSFSNFADFAAGRVNTATLLFGSTLAYWQRYPWDLFWQDTYKVKDNLTLNYGVRYEYPSAIHQVRNQATNFIPGVGPVLLGSNQLLTIDTTLKGPASLKLVQTPLNLSSTGVTSDKNNFAPVLGFAYTPRFARSVFGKDDTVIRGGFRMGYDEIFNNIPANMALNAPFNLTTTQNKGTNGGKKFPWATGLNQNVPLVKFIGQPNQVGLVGISAEDQNIRSSYIYQYSLGIQRRLGSAFSLEVDYQGSNGHALGLFVDQNQ